MDMCTYHNRSSMWMNYTYPNMFIVNLKFEMPMCCEDNSPSSDVRTRRPSPRPPTPLSLWLAFPGVGDETSKEFGTAATHRKWLMGVVVNKGEPSGSGGVDAVGDSELVAIPTVV